MSETGPNIERTTRGTVPPNPMMQALPSTAFWGDDGKMYHRIERTTEGGSKVVSVRRLAMTLDEARDQHLDFFHPTLGLIWEGYKLAKDRTPESIMRDTSVGGGIPAGEVGLPQ